MLREGDWDEGAHQSSERAKGLAKFEEAVRALGDPAAATSEDIDRARAFAKELGMDFVDLAAKDIDAATAAAIAPDLAIRVKAVPLKVTAKSAHFAVANPLDSRLVAELRRALNANLTFSIATETSQPWPVSRPYASEWLTDPTGTAASYPSRCRSTYGRMPPCS